MSVASEILSRDGLHGLSTRMVAQRAGLQTPTLYRLFGDKQGLVDAVVHDWHRDHLRVQQSVAPSTDPVDDLRAGWDAHVRFGLSDPRLYTLAQGEGTNAAPPQPATEAVALLAARVHRLAEHGLLRVPEHRAVQLVLATGRGVTLSLLHTPEDERDLGLSVLAREAVVVALVGTDAAAGKVTGVDTGGVPDAGHGLALTRTVTQLLALLPRSSALSAAERRLLEEWLHRIGEESTDA
ncbi:TetR/AcrR family transcriptional regulator [Pedococcus aerophilus]|uniref:TetR/AcrR family transcriptional regulator n=1 Tax=Pedococcus aerophilus TaxID=436356 RepID=A0ABN3UE91_9MICO